MRARREDEGWRGRVASKRSSKVDAAVGRLVDGWAASNINISIDRRAA